MQTVKWLQVLLFNINNSIQHYSFICTQSNGSKYSKVSWTIQLNISHLFSRSLNVMCAIDRTLSGATTPGSNDNEEVFHIPRNRASQSDCLVSYPRHSLEVGSYSSARMQSVYSTGPADLTRPLQVRVHLGVMVIKDYSILLKAPGIEPHHLIV